MSCTRRSLLELLGGAGQRDLAALDHHRPVGDRQRDVDLLLDDQHGDSLVGPVLRGSRGSAGSAPGRGRATARRTAAPSGRATKACASASICCWPPLRSRAGDRSLPRSMGNMSSTWPGERRSKSRASRADRGAEADVVGDAQLREDAMAVEHQAQALAARLVLGRLPVMSRPLEQHRAPRRLDEAGDRLAAASTCRRRWPPRTSTTLARLHRETDAVQHRAPGRSRRAGSRTSSIASLPVNSARTRGSLDDRVRRALGDDGARHPARVIRSATRQTRLRSCSTSTIVLPRRVAQVAQQRREVAPLLLREAGRRLVEQQHVAVHGDDAQHFEQPALRVRQEIRTLRAPAVLRRRAAPATASRRAGGRGRNRRRSAGSPRSTGPRTRAASGTSAPRPAARCDRQGAGSCRGRAMRNAAADRRAPGRTSR